MGHHQQIVFDAQPDYFAKWTNHLAESNVLAVEQATESGGTISALPDDVQEVIRDSQAAAITDDGESAAVSQAIASEPEAIGDSWLSVAEEMGYSDGGDLQEMAEWFSADDADFLPYATRLYEEVFLPHRPE